MPRSAALATYRKAVPEARWLLERALEASDILREGQRMSDRELSLRSVMVVLVGNLQAYLGNIVDELCDNLPSDWNRLTLVQKRYIAVHAYRVITELPYEFEEKLLNESTKINQFMKRISGVAKWLDDPGAFTRTASKQEVQGFLGDNGTQALDRAVSLHGPQRFSDWLDSKPQFRGLLGSIDPLVQLRNDVAHGVFNRRVTDNDARQNFVLVNKLVARIEVYLSLPPKTSA